MESETKPSLWPLALLGILFSTLALFTSHKRDQSSESVHPQDTTGRKHESASQSKFAFTSDANPASRDTGNTNQCRYPPTPKWQVTVQIGAVVIALGLLIVNTCQMDATRRSVRPRVSIINVGPVSMTAHQLPLDHGKLHVSFQVPNYGLMPARNFRVRTFDNVSSWDQVRKLPYGKPIWDLPQIVFPTASTGPAGWGATGKRILTPNEITILSGQSPRLVATFSILIEYDDDWGISHRAEYCDEFTFPPDSFNNPCPWPVQND